MLSSILAYFSFNAITRSEPVLTSQGLSGYISMEVAAPPEEFRYGVSLYATAWPLVEKPLRDFQIGLASIWIIPDNREINYPLLPKGTVARDNWPERGPSYRDVFQTIEGGLGFWANTRYGSSTAKFRMNGTANGYNHEISSPGWGFGGSGGKGAGRALNPDQMGIAQLSSRILVPPDGLTFRDGTCGELFGYAWMALPLTEQKSTTAGLPIPTGNQCWTLFLNSRNFKGPVAFYTPATWSRISRTYAPAVARGLDARPGLVTGGAIEVNTVPQFVSQAGYSRIPRLQFPVDENGRTVLIHGLTHYSKGALYRQMEAWIKGGQMPSGQFDDKSKIVPRCTTRPLSVHQGEKNLPVNGLGDWVETKVFDDSTFGLQWKSRTLLPWTKDVRKGTFPEFFRQGEKEVTALSDQSVPSETNLKTTQFPVAARVASYTSPPRGDNVWYRPGPKAGPFTAKLADGSVVTYFWYRFIDQPSLQDADLSAEEKGRLQALVEKIHANWTIHKPYMAPPRIGELASLDSALMVMPPRGLEVGYVPIAVRQDPSERDER